MNAELANAKEALRVLESLASADRSTMPSAINGRDSVQGELATTSAELQVAKEVPTAAFEQLNGHSRNLEAVNTMVQEYMKSNLRNC